MMADDDWVRAAMTDDAAVVELLLRLKQSQATTMVKSEVSLVVLPRWGVQQPRSKLRCDATVLQRKEADSTRCSPTTPLSWSGGSSGASPSATGDGFDESIRPSNIYPAGGRSKGFAATETTSISTKRSRKKKTYAGLKEEESLLLKEKNYLKEELAALCATVKEQRTRNESLKRMKLDLDLRSTRNGIATSCEEEKATLNQPNQTPTLPMTHAACDDLISSYSCQAPKAVSKRDSLFVLPDLNMMPTEEDSSF